MSCHHICVLKKDLVNGKLPRQYLQMPPKEFGKIQLPVLAKLTMKTENDYENTDITFILLPVLFCIFPVF